MKKYLSSVLVMIAMSVSGVASAAITSVVCTDPSPSQSVDVYFTTESAAAKKFATDQNNIGFDFGNRKQSVFLAGQMEVAPKVGGFLLKEESEHYGTLKLALFHKNGESFSGRLTGMIEINGDWKRINEYKLDCKVQQNRW